MIPQLSSARQRAWLGLFAITALAACHAARARPARAPNVLVILADDLGYADLGFTGCRDIKTPHIDSLAARGVVCTDGHVSGCVCAPSRAGLLTGRYQSRQGFEGNGDALLADTRTLAHAMRDAGYTTLGVGKWHLGPDPRSVGFDHFTGLAGGSRPYLPSAETAAAGRLRRDGQDVELAGWSYLTDFLTEEGMRLVRERRADQPFFLYMSYTTPHTPLDARPDLLREYADIAHPGRRKYAAMVASLDEEVGEWLEFLEREQLAADTIVVLLSDNGGATINWSDNGPWRGMKGSWWEGGQRVPFVVSWPGTLAPGSYGMPVISLDLLPTFLAAGGHTAPPSDGVDLLPFLTGSRAGRPHPQLFWRTGPAAAVRDHDLVLIRTREENGDVHGITLFDLATDPGQSRNLAAERAADRDRLLELLGAWEQELPAPRGTIGEVYRNNLRRKHEMDVIGREAERKLP